MKKFINNVDDFLKESLSGFGKAHSDIIKVNFEPNFISRKTKTKEGKVSLISGGGSVDMNLCTVVLLVMEC